LLSVTSVGAAANKQAERNCSLTPPYLPSTAVNTSLQLQQLREKMQSLRISAYIIPGTDAHLSEYIASRDARLAFITGFTGSAGTAVVTQSKAVLWTDSRYWVQAERQMDCNWELEKDGSLCNLLQFPPLETYQNYASYLESSSLHLEPKAVNLVDVVWGDRPPLSSESIFRLPDRVISMIFFLILIVHLFVWLFNLRGNDIPYNPFFYSYTLLTLNEIWLFVHTERVTKDVEEYLTAHCSDPLCVQLKPYDSVLRDLTTYIGQPGVKVWIGTEYTNYALYEIIPQEKLITSTYSPVLTSKAVKDQTEEQVLRDAHVRDAVAVIQLLMWLEKAVPQGNETELSAAEYVNKCRSKQKDNRGPSFETISASGANAALAHYSPSVETNRRLTVDEMYLVDSGGQYLDGTTDITRTVHWGTPTPMQKEAFTRVLMGNIEISRTVFPSGTRGVNIEMLGRRALWEVGLNYGHGTGHGVGNYFGVHEWPVGFQTNNIPFRAGMFTSIEPGYYKENDFGIRIEDIAVTVPAQTKYGNNYLTFDTVSLVPYDRKLIDIALLSSEQLQWLNNYYMTIRQLVGPELVKQGLHEENDWMLKNTDPFPEFGSSASICSSSLTLIALK
uniref:X-prolyl aminopeptidase (aminopeptidase P) 2, membrane-bound n=1 Tax=Oryzias sinensis TaxID=183150 RepID=A0A8C7ZP19_9TELE